MKQILYDMGNFFLDHNQILRPYNYVISGLYCPPWIFFIALFHVSEHVGYFKASNKNFLLVRLGTRRGPPPCWALCPSLRVFFEASHNNDNS